MSVIFVVGVLFIVFSVFMIFRNETVYKKRVALIWDDHEAYERLPDYGHMLLRFWIPVRRFIEEAKEK